MNLNLADQHGIHDRDTDSRTKVAEQAIEGRRRIVLSRLELRIREDAERRQKERDPGAFQNP